MSGIADSVGFKVRYTRASPCFWSFTLLLELHPASRASPGRGFTRSPETPYNADPCWLDAGGTHALMQVGRGSDADGTHALMQVGRGSDAGRTRVGRRSDAGRTQVGRRSDAGRTQVGRRSDAGRTQVGRRSDAGRTQPLILFFLSWTQVGRGSDAGRTQVGRRSDAGRTQPLILFVDRFLKLCYVGVL
jgi:hypothetical protein